MFEFIINKPNHVPERQRAYQAMSGPIYFRTPRSKLYVYTYLAAFTGGMLASAYGSYRLITGTGKKDEAA